MNDRVIRISGKWAKWTGALHPAVECIMHEQIHQDRTDHTTLGCATVPRQARAICRLERCSQPPLDIQQDPVFPDVNAYRLHQEAMIDLIEGCLDVKLDQPVILPAPISGDGHRLFRRPTRPVSIRVRM